MSWIKTLDITKFKYHPIPFISVIDEIIKIMELKYITCVEYCLDN